MNNDLISKSKLLEALRQEEDEYEEAMTTPSYWSAIRIIKEQPIAYDVENIVQQLEELKEYRRLEKEGLIFKLPCKEGDTVYTINSYIDCCNEECKLTKEECDECSDYKRFYFVKETKFQIQMIAQLGRVLFLTKEEAEQKLRGL